MFTLAGMAVQLRRNTQLSLKEAGRRRCRAEVLDMVVKSGKVEYRLIRRWFAVSIHRNSIDTGKMRRSSLDPTFLLA